MAPLILKLFRVPPEPQAPDGSPDSIRIFRAGRNYYRWLLIQWALAQAVVVVSLVAATLVTPPFFAKIPATWRYIWLLVQVLIEGAAVVFIVVSYFAIRLNYELRWYIVTDRSLRIRSGIWSVEELTMTFANIQDMRINAGPLQNFLGLADLVVSSAGGGQHVHPGQNPHLANFSGVDDAAGLRDLLAERLRQYRDAGLGDHEHAPAAVASSSTSSEMAAAQRVLAEARALRAAL